MSLNNLTFKGGIRIKGEKELTKDKPIEKALEPEMVHIPLHQHSGAPCKPLVKRGDKVKVGQKIGESEAFLSAPVHSSVSGVVRRIGNTYTHDGYNVQCVVIESDGLNEIHESVKPKGDLESLSKEEILDAIREAGIAGMGGAAYPTHAKIADCVEDGVQTVILNGAECEPYLTCDYRIMVEKPDLVVQGLRAILKIVDSNDGYIGIEDDKMEAVEKIKEAASKENNIKVATMKTKFPQGDSYRLVDSLTGRKVPKGGRCKDVGAIVNNVGTAVAIAEAILEGKPLYERVVTVTGDGVKEPKNLLVKIGTTIGDVIAQCGGFNGKPGKIIAGGPMTGHAQFSLDTPIAKGTTGIIVQREESVVKDKVSPCIQCGKCIEVCPINLEPLFISAYALKDRFEEAESLSAEACIECGSCSYICPSKRPLSESIAFAKQEIRANRRKSQ